MMVRRGLRAGVDRGGPGPFGGVPETCPPGEGLVPRLLADNQEHVAVEECPDGAVELTRKFDVAEVVRVGQHNY
jgi:hypothetical protein